jgi:hypothetical protein
MTKPPAIPVHKRCDFVFERQSPSTRWQSCKRLHARRRRGSFYPCRRRPSIALAEVMGRNEQRRSTPC